MDQVLFSEPSNKMKAKLSADRQAELLALKTLEELRASSAKSSSATENEVEKLLNDKFNK